MTVPPGAPPRTPIAVGITNMWRFFSTINQFPESASLGELEARFRAQKSSGVIEKVSSAGTHSIQLIAGGATLKTYDLPDPRSTSSTAQTRTHAVVLEDTAARLTWLALESHSAEQNSIPDKTHWDIFLDNLRIKKWSGLLEIRCEDAYGLMLFRLGELQRDESVFQASAEFSKDNGPGQFPVETTLLESGPDSPPYQCFVLRKGITRWTDHLLARCQEMIGRRMLHTIERELNHAIEPWNWRIALKDDALHDNHFFVNTQEAAQAYREVFMGIGNQLNFFIGSNITQRILNESFEQLPADERDALGAQRLIPAAFTL